MFFTKTVRLAKVFTLKCSYGMYVYIVHANILHVHVHTFIYVCMYVCMLNKNTWDVKKCGANQHY